MTKQNPKGHSVSSLLTLLPRDLIFVWSPRPFWYTVNWIEISKAPNLASQITSLTIVYSTVYSGTDERKHQNSASLAFVRGIHPWPVNSSHKGPVTRKTFPLDGVVMTNASIGTFPQLIDFWQIYEVGSPSTKSFICQSFYSASQTWT